MRDAFAARAATSAAANVDSARSSAALFLGFRIKQRFLKKGLNRVEGVREESCARQLGGRVDNSNKGLRAVRF